MIEETFLSNAPRLEGSDHFIAQNAALIGKVILKNAVNIWYGAVLRADEDSITIDEKTNIQDNVVIHTDHKKPVHIGKHVTIGHGAVIHGCTIGNETLIGMNATILNGAQIGKECMIGANSLVPENMIIPDGSLVLGLPAKIKRTLSIDERAALKKHAEHYVTLAMQYLLENKKRG